MQAGSTNPNNLLMPSNSYMPPSLPGNRNSYLPGANPRESCLYDQQPILEQPAVDELSHKNAESLQKNLQSVQSIADEGEIGEDCGEFAKLHTKTQIIINAPLISNLHSNY